MKQIPPLGASEVRIYSLATGDRDVVRQVSRTILSALLNVSADALVFVYTEQGKPLLQDYPWLHYSTSHAESASLIAVTRYAAVGVDIEKIRAVPNAEKILKRFFSESERNEILAISDSEIRDERFMQAWTRAEAVVKARGGSVWELATVDSTATVKNIETVTGYAAAIAVAVLDFSPDWKVTRYEYVV